MNGRKPDKLEKAWLDKIVEYGCCVCRNEGSFTHPQIHHIDGSKKEGCHFKTLPLCFYHHMQGSDNDFFTSRHPFKARFELRYGTENELLKQLQEIING